MARTQDAPLGRRLLALMSPASGPGCQRHGDTPPLGPLADDTPQPRPRDAYRPLEQNRATQTGQRGFFLDRYVY